VKLIYIVFDCNWERLKAKGFQMLLNKEEDKTNIGIQP